MPNLLLCMTPGVGLGTWERIGILGRELLPYREFARRGWRIRILTYDGGDIPGLPDGIEAVRFPDHRLLWMLPWSHRGLGRWADVIKTNQSSRAFYYTAAARRWKKPLLLRCGYVHGEYLEATEGRNFKVRAYQMLEAGAFRAAAMCQVSTAGLSEWVKQRYRVPSSKVVVVPNFVETGIFSPVNGSRENDRKIISVGRLAPVKRFDLLVRACAGILGCSLTIVGEGPERDRLESLAGRLGVRLHLAGSIPNGDLPKVLLSHSVFAITSMWEGHPKALIEAMACGMGVVGVDAIGIREVIRHGENGLLCRAEESALSDAMRGLMEDRSIAHRLGRNARRFVVDNYSAEAVFSTEARVLEKLALHAGCGNKIQAGSVKGGA